MELLKIGYWNINSINTPRNTGNRAEKISRIMAGRQIDILVCSESKRPGGDQKLKFAKEVLDRGYGVGYVDGKITFWSCVPKEKRRSKANGGVMIILSEEFECKRTRGVIAPVDVQFLRQHSNGSAYRLLSEYNSQSNKYSESANPIPGNQSLNMIVFTFRTRDEVTVSLIGCYAPTSGRDTEWDSYMKALKAVINFERNRGFDRHLVAVCGDLNVDYSYRKNINFSLSLWRRQLEL